MLDSDFSRGDLPLFNEEIPPIPITVWLVMGKVDGLRYGVQPEKQASVNSNAKGWNYRLSGDNACVAPHTEVAQKCNFRLCLPPIICNRTFVVLQRAHGSESPPDRPCGPCHPGEARCNSGYHHHRGAIRRLLLLLVPREV